MNIDDFNWQRTGGIKFYRMKNGIWRYPLHFIIRYNVTILLLELMGKIINYLLVVMTKLEKEQFHYTARGAWENSNKETKINKPKGIK